MRLLLDENLSPRLVPRLRLLFPQITHVRDVGLSEAHDKKIWEWATVHGYSIVTTDRDFLAMSQRLGWPPKVIHIERCDFRSRIIEEMLRRNAVRIANLEKDAGKGVLLVRLHGEVQAGAAVEPE